MEWQEEMVSLSEGEMHVIRTPAGRPPVVLLHGFSDSGACWPRLAADLADSCSVIMPDLRGHGRTRLTGFDCSRERMAADVAELLEALKSEPVVVIGHSMGGEVAAHLAVDRPDRVRAVVLEDPPWHMPSAYAMVPGFDPSPKANPIYSWITELRTHTPAEITARCRAENPTWDESEVAPWVDSKLAFDLSILKSLLGFSRLPWEAPWQDLLLQLKQPAMLMWSDGPGAIITADVAADFERLTSQGRSQFIPAAGHSIRRENFAAVSAAIHQFLKLVG